MPITDSNTVRLVDATCQQPLGLNAEWSGPASGGFTTGSRIELADGPCAIEHITAGDLVRTLDNSSQPVRSVHHQTVRAYGTAAPILFEAGTIGNAQAMLVAPDQRVLITDWRAELLLGCDEVLVAATDLVNGRDVRVIEGGEVTYVHLTFDQPQIVFADGSTFECGIGAAANQTLAARMIAARPEAACLMAA